MADQPNDDGRVSKEAHERIVRERDELKAERDQLAVTVGDLGRARKIEDFLEAKKVDNVRGVAELLLPHVRDVEVDKLEETLGSDRYKPWIERFVAPATPASDGDGDGGDPPAPPADPGAGFSGAGPNPGGSGDSLDPNRKVSRDEVRRLHDAGQHAEAQKLYDEGRVEEPARPY